MIQIKTNLGRDVVANVGLVVEQYHAIGDFDGALQVRSIGSLVVDKIMALVLATLHERMVPEVESVESWKALLSIISIVLLRGGWV